jgi:hypothetical protein
MPRSAQALVYRHISISASAQDCHQNPRNRAFLAQGGMASAAVTASIMMMIMMASVRRSFCSPLFPPCP